jgi:hypothetical protein
VIADASVAVLTWMPSVGEVGDVGVEAPLP